METSLILLSIAIVFRVGICYGLEHRDLLVLKEKGDFQHAQKACHDKGMIVVRVKNEEQNRLVNDLSILKDIGQYWIDANDLHKTGEWVNSDGKPLTYKNWGEGKKESIDATHRCIEVHEDLEWDAVRCSTKNAIICQKKPVDHNLKTIQLLHIDGKTTYKSAYEECKKRGFELVTIESSAMNKVIYDFAMKKNLGSYWVDMHYSKKREGWITSDLDPVEYKNWAHGEPSESGKEGCAIVAYHKDPFWYNVSCKDKETVICFKYL